MLALTICNYVYYNEYRKLRVAWIYLANLDDNLKFTIMLIIVPHLSSMIYHFNDKVKFIPKGH